MTEAWSDLVLLMRGHLPPYLCQERWQQLADLATPNFLAGYLYAKAKDRKDLPLSVYQDLKNSHILIAGQAMLAERLYSQVEKLFGKNDIKLMPCKGLVFRYLLYDDLAVRIASDVDLLVKKEDFEGCHQLLLEAGYRRKIRNPDRLLTAEALFERVYVDPKTTPGEISLDLHWAFSQDIRYPVFSQDIWRRSLTVAQFLKRTGFQPSLPLPFAANCRLMTPEDAVCHQFLHNAMHLFDISLRNVLDIKLVLDKWQPDLEQVFRRAQEWKVATAAYLSLAIVESLFPKTVPDWMLRRLRPAWGRRAWLKLLIPSKPRPRKNDPSGFLSYLPISDNHLLQQMLLGLPLIDDQRRRIRFTSTYLSLRVRELWRQMIKRRDK
jgi:hypothetical protein